MTQDEIIEMARQVDCLHVNLTGDRAKALERLEAFAKLVAAKEREACAKICGEYNFGQAPKMIQEAIRARGEA